VDLTAYEGITHQSGAAIGHFGYFVRISPYYVKLEPSIHVGPLLVAGASSVGRPAISESPLPSFLWPIIRDRGLKKKKLRRIHGPRPPGLGQGTKRMSSAAERFGRNQDLLVVLGQQVRRFLLIICPFLDIFDGCTPYTPYIGESYISGPLALSLLSVNMLNPDNRARSTAPIC
jgi:hypothetical protein